VDLLLKWGTQSALMVAMLAEKPQTINETSLQTAVSGVSAAALQAGPESPLQQTIPASQPVSKAGKLLDLAMFCCLLGGAVAICRAMKMEDAIDGMLCLLGALAGCSLLCYLYFRAE
jgi:hypothetical protein